jgi:hypothetical protein
MDAGGEDAHNDKYRYTYYVIPHTGGRHYTESTTIMLRAA